MNFHLDKIECVFILLNILMVHITSANMSSSYKLKNIILPPYIGKLQDGLDSKLLALRKVRILPIINIFHRYFIFVFIHKYQTQLNNSNGLYYGLHKNMLFKIRSLKNHI